jgi:hypothetical protein
VIRGVGSTIEFVETTEQSDGERVVVEIAYEGTGERPPVHYHPAQDEHFEVLEGEIHAIVGDVEHVLRAGDTLDVPAGVRHQMWCDVPSRQRWTTTPALRTERFFETLWGLQRDGKTSEQGIPSPPQMALTLRHFAPEFRVVSPPEPVQQVLFPVLGALGRARGLRPEYRPGAAP